jgi:hypothetical protein
MITLDGFDLLKSIGTSKKAFTVVQDDIEKAALSIMKKLLKAKGLSVPQLREVCRAVRPEALALVIDNLADKEVSSLATKIDKLWPNIKTAPIHQKREHILSIAEGRTEPTAKAPAPPKTPKGKRAKRASEPSAKWSSSMSARPPRS